MDLQRLLLKNTAIARYFLERVPSGLLLKLGKKKSSVAIKFAKKTKAYSTFLKKQNLLNEKKLENLPIIDKNNYIDKYSLEELAIESLEDNYTIEQSSGYGGKPYYWVRYVGQDDTMSNYLQLGLEKTFLIHKRKTIFINTMALGTWVAGTKLARSSCEVANKKGNRMTVINAGTVKEDIVNAIKDLAQYYEQILFIGYPPLLEDIFETTVKQGYFPKEKHIGIIAGGESFPESWRDYVTTLFEKVSVKDLRIFSAFGAADTGLEIGYEQPITVKLRKLLAENHELRHKYLGEKVNYTPHFFQYNPMSIYIEEHKGELVFTARAGIPIVRYNLHDSGGIFTYQEMRNILKDGGVDVEKYEKENKPMKLPIVYIYGRSDGSISVDGANIYIQDIQSVLTDDEKLFKYMNINYKKSASFEKKVPYPDLAGKIFEESNYLDLDKEKYFRIINSFKLSGNLNRIEVFIELMDGVKLNNKEREIFRKGLFKAMVLLLMEQSANYRALVEEQLKSSDLILHIVQYGEEPFSLKKSIKKKHIIK
ncbi:hypothetical protein GF389_00550 [Candidatus Dojkabacteria bacterium]|nr:hypothetical protein [Candidatus Dojkabacteria bacterium]